MGEPRVASITLFPIKALDGVSVDTAVISPGGALAMDRCWALMDADGPVNGKRCPEIHAVRAHWRLSGEDTTVELGWKDEVTRTFVPAREPDAVAAWFAQRLQRPVRLDRDDRLGFPDDRGAWGPTVVARETLEVVAGWFDRPLGEIRRRFRTNIEIEGGGAFWDDRLFGPAEPLRFRIGQVLAEGINPCQRCVVPSRNPDTGEPLAGFQKVFSRLREAERPSWAARNRFDHHYRLAVNTRIPLDQAGRTVHICDIVSLDPG